MKDWQDRLTDEETPLVKQAAQPNGTTPMLATLTDKRFTDPDWIFERKFDGERALGFRNGGKMRLLTRNRKDISDTYPEIVDALRDQSREDYVVDGEVVAFRGAQTSFSRLRRRMQIKDPDKARGTGVAVCYYLFDLLQLDGDSLERLPLPRSLWIPWITWIPSGRSTVSRAANRRNGGWRLLNGFTAQP